MTSPTIVWFRQDLRLSDNPALSSAIERGGPIIPLFILDDAAAGDWTIGGAGRWWLHQSLSALDESFRQRGGQLILRRGSAPEILRAVIDASGADAVYWNRCYEPDSISRDRSLKSDLSERGLDVRSFNSALIAEPWEVETQSGKPYRVFTPFWKTVTKSVPVARPLAAPQSLSAPSSELKSETLDTWSLTPKTPDWARGLRDTWVPGEKGAQDRLNAFLDESLTHYADGRDIPSQDFTSRLSPHLHWGEISPRQIWMTLERDTPSSKNVEKLKSELGWREFSYHLLFHFPDLPTQNLRTEFDSFPWEQNNHALEAWQKGETGYPIVDAGMRQLWHTGWMHNRVRMITASFLVKHLLQPWQTGASWFWDTLVDADLASNSASWQWVAGCGADAAPYFRIFNPVLQGEKFDPEGLYVKQWVPELASIESKKIHTPWTLTSPRADYPWPVIDLSAGRNRALSAYQTMKASAADN